jgi:hypothetical protein
MAGRTLMAIAGQLAETRLMPGDIAMQGEQFFPGGLTTAGAGTVTGAMIAAGLLRRTGPGAGFTDTFDTATNILAALGFLPATGGTNTQFGAGLTDVGPGSTFRFRYILGVAQVMTFNATVPEGLVYAIANTSMGLAGVAGNWREYLLTINNVTPRQSLSVISNTSTTTQFSSPQPVGTVTPGMWLSGSNVTSGTLVTGVIHGQGVITGFTTSAASTGSATQAWVFSPTITVDSVGSGVL